MMMVIILVMTVSNISDLYPHASLIFSPNGIITFLISNKILITDFEYD